MSCEHRTKVLYGSCTPLPLQMPQQVMESRKQQDLQDMPQTHKKDAEAAREAYT